MIAIVSDVHGNVAALEAVLAEADAIGCDRIISLGDIVGYYGQPGACIDLLRDREAINIMGNHDYYLVSDTECTRSRLVSELASFQRDRISDEQVAWLARSLPSLTEGDTVYVHGGWKDTQDQYLYKIRESDLPPYARRFFSGHTHVQALVTFGERSYCNPGSVGQPRDGNPQAAFATVGEEGIRLHRVPYDIERTAADMRTAGFPPRIYENLYIGAQIGGRIDSITVVYDESKA